MLALAPPQNPYASQAMEKVLLDLVNEGGPHNLYLIQCTHAQYPEALALLQRLAKSRLVGLCHIPSEEQEASVEWGKLSKKKLWVASPFIDNVGAPGAESLMRRAAVEVLCARTNQCAKTFKVFLFATAEALSRFPRVALHLSSTKSGCARVARLDDIVPIEFDPSEEVFEEDIPTAEGIIFPSLEDWMSYDQVEDAAGPIAQLQEDVFNSVPSITKLKYDPECGEGAPFVRIMRDALKFNLCIHTLDLTKSFAGDVIGSCLGAVLHTSRKLENIKLRECSLTDVGITDIAAALRLTPVVKWLCLEKNPSIQDVGLVALADALSGDGTLCQLQHLDMSHNNALYSEEKQWGSQALAIFWDALGAAQFLVSVSLAECGLGPAHVYEAGYRWLQKTPTLRRLALNDNAFGDEAAALIFESIVNVEELDLSHTGLSAAGFRAAGYAISQKSLTSLKLNSNNAMLQRAVNVEQYPELTKPMRDTLLLERDAIEFFFASLSGNTTLTSLELSRVNIGDHGVCALCDHILLGNCAVSHVDISSNCNIEEESSHKIKELICGGYYNKTDEEGEEEEEDNDKNQNVEKEENTGQLVVVDVSRKPFQLKSISLAGNATSIGERALLALYTNNGLQAMDLTDMALSDAMLLPLAEAVVSNPNMVLRSLRLGRNFFFVDAPRFVATLITHSKTLEEVSFAATWAEFTDESGRGSSLSKTREKGLHYLRPLANSLAARPPPTLKILDMSFNDMCDAVAAVFVDAIAGNDVFEELIALGNPISEEFAIKEPRLVLKAVI